MIWDWATCLYTMLATYLATGLLLYVVVFVLAGRRFNIVAHLLLAALHMLFWPAVVVYWGVQYESQWSD